MVGTSREVENEHFLYLGTELFLPNSEREAAFRNSFS